MIVFLGFLFVIITLYAGFQGIVNQLAEINKTLKSKGGEGRK